MLMPPADGSRTSRTLQFKGRRQAAVSSKETLPVPVIKCDPGTAAVTHPAAAPQRVSGCGPTGQTGPDVLRLCMWARCAADSAGFSQSTRVRESLLIEG